MSSRGYAGVSWSKGSVAKRAVLSDLRSPVRRAANLPPRARRANSSLSSFVTVFVISSAPRTSHLSHRPSSFHEKLSFQGDEYEGDTSPRFELPTSRFGGRRVDLFRFHDPIISESALATLAFQYQYIIAETRKRDSRNLADYIAIKSTLLLNFR